MIRRLLLPFIALALIAVCIFTYTPLTEKVQQKVAVMEANSVSLPKASVTVSSGAILPQVNLPVPFTAQAPTANWDELHEDACEEASVAMVLRYFASAPFSDSSDADSQIQHLVELNENVFGYGKSQTAQQVVEMLEHESDHLNVSIIPATEESFKKALSKDSLIIVPAAGKDLKNPYFQRPPPLYHMLVIRGYTKDGHVITNDPGTKRGEAFPYTWPVLLNAIHDWNDGNVDTGEKVAILIGSDAVENFEAKSRTETGGSILNND